MRGALLVLTLALGVSIAGCGVDGDLTCGYSTCESSTDAQARGATSAAPVVGPVGDHDASLSGDGARVMHDGGPETDSSAPVSTADGGGPQDAAPLGDGCVMCGLGPCCAPSHECIASGTTCCSNLSGSCGGELGSCCGALVCTATHRCGASCVAMMGSCSQQSDCCLGNYCDTSLSLQCLQCIAMTAACSQSYECCSGTCRNSQCVSE